MKVGFTGTRAGMSAAQRSQLRYVLALFAHADRMVGRVPEFHYGTHQEVELKADTEAAGIAAVHGYKLVAHHAMRGEELARDREEAKAVDVMVAAPRTDQEERRSGTWATVRYARAELKPVVQLARGRRGKQPVRRIDE